MAALNKVRVQLLDPTTGAVVEEVDILTSADSVTFADGETFQQKLNLGKLKGDKGDKGDTGAAGAQGIQGVKGDKGDPGINLIWHFVNAASAPTTTLGAIGDWAVNTNGQTYEKTGTTTWTARASIKGAQGIQGVKGDKGDPGDSVKFGTTYATAVATKVFFKKI